MLASLAFVLGIALGVGTWAAFGRALPASIPAGRPPTALGWWTLVLGVAAVASFLLGSRLLGGTEDGALRWLLASIALATASVIVGVATVQRGDRRWPSWLGLLLGAAPALAWLAFALGSLLAGGG